MTQTSLTFAFLSFILVYFITYLVRKISLKTGFCSKPSGERWKKERVAMGGGIGVMVVLLTLLALLDIPLAIDLGPAFLALCIFGFVDDLVNFMPKTKLFFQTIAASWIVARGYHFPGQTFHVFTYIPSVLWIVFLTNALNLNDNMDGLCSGIVAIASFSFLWALSGSSSPLVALLPIVFAAMLAFLSHNFNPARIFLGDAGSLPLGCLLAILSFEVMQHGSGSPPVLALQALLILCVPIFDVTFVIMRRAQLGKPLFRGNIDHISHRLVRGGLSEHVAVSLLYAIGISGGVTAILISNTVIPILLSVTLVSGAFFLLFALFLYRLEKPNPSISWFPFLNPQK